jgi:hypothetical protein
MSNALIPAEFLGTAKYATQKAMTEVSSVGDYLPRVQVMGSMSGPVKEGQFPMGHFALVRSKQNEDIGSEFNCLLLSWRPKAMQYSPDVKSIYDPNSDAFKDIKSRSNVPNAGCGYGPEYLMWLPDQQCLATFFFGNATGRNEAPSINAYLQQNGGTGICTFKSILIKNEKKRQSWHGAKVFDCAVELVLPENWADVGVEIEKFNNPSEKVVEVAAETSGR